MRRVNVKKVEEGMVLARDVVDQRGRLLLPKGAEVAANHLRYFRMLDVQVVYIEGGNDEQNGGGDDIVVTEEVRRKVQDRFRFTDLEHPMVQELFQYCLKLTAKREAAREVPSGE